MSASLEAELVRVSAMSVLSPARSRKSATRWMWKEWGKSEVKRK